MHEAAEEIVKHLYERECHASTDHSPLTVIITWEYGHSCVRFILVKESFNILSLLLLLPFSFCRTFSLLPSGIIFMHLAFQVDIGHSLNIAAKSE
jgi:hypothetical protein